MCMETMTYILRSRLTTHSSGRGVSLPFVVNEWFRLIDCSLECISAVVLRDVVAGSSLSEKSGRVGDLSLARRNARRCGLKILSPPSYLVLPDDTTQYLSTFQPSKQAEVVRGITR